MVSFLIPVTAFGFWLTDTLGDPFTISAFDQGGALLGSSTIIGPAGSPLNEPPIFIDLAFSTPIASFSRRRFDPINGNPPACCTSDFEIDDLVFRGVPEPGTFALLGLGFAGLAALQRRRN